MRIVGNIGEICDAGCALLTTLDEMSEEGLVIKEPGCNLPPALRAEAQIDSHHPFEYFHLLRKRDPTKGEEIEDDYAGV